MPVLLPMWLPIRVPQNHHISTHDARRINDPNQFTSRLVTGRLIEVNAAPLQWRYFRMQLHTKPTRIEMSYKTIAVYLAQPDSVSSVMDVALPLAESFGAHLIGLHISSRVPVMGTIGAQVPPEIIDQYIQIMRQDAKAIEASFAKAVKGAKIQSEWRGHDENAAGADQLHSITEQT
ncbi:MAG: hypothetical protein V3S78_06565, partial [Hyphomicrobium sp.]